jgi:hypothetical protein
VSIQVPTEVVDAVQSGTTTITRRVEIFEADATTKWDPEGDTDYDPRVTGGNVTVDYDRDERRAADIQFDNRDNSLRQDPAKGFWYDKIIKCFRGVEYASSTLAPKIVIVDAPSSTVAYQIRSILSQLGFNRTDVALSSPYTALKSYDIFVSYNPTGGATSATVFQQAYVAGKGVMTFGNGFTSAHLPWVTTTGGPTTMTLTLTPSTGDNPLKGGWTAETTTTTDSTITLTGLDGTTSIVATNGATSVYTAVVASNTAGGRWFHYAPHQIQTQGKILIRKAVEWIRDWKPTKEWEVQIGEFMIDRFSEPNKPRILSVSCRDMSKKMLTSKLEKSISFAKGTPIVMIVQALAANSGITKMRLPTSNKALPDRVDLERGTPRWTVCKDICTANNFELFFDAQGYLCMRAFIDPSFGPITQVFKTGKISDGGNLVEYTRSADDSRLFNHIVVVGERENDTLAPFFAEVKNTNPASPTNVARIGDRLMDPVVGSYFTSTAQCFETAHNMMKVAALESYELTFSSIMYQWLEVGEVIQILEPNALETDPDRYLLTSLSLPMALGPMSGSGKRVTIIQDDDYVLSIDNPSDPGMESGA